METCELGDSTSNVISGGETNSLEERCLPEQLKRTEAVVQQLAKQVQQLLSEQSTVYLDDIIVFGKSVEEHLDQLREVLTRLQNAGLKIKPSKCHLMQTRVRYLGHIVSSKGIETDPEKVRCVSDWPTPTDQRSLKQFMGLASYYRRFVQGFAQVAAPLNALTEKTKTWEWTAECNGAFLELKKRLVSAPILVMPCFNHKFILDTDASGEGLGAVLSQSVDGQERVVAYASKTLSKTERRYCATRRELLAVVWATQHFRPYLYGCDFLLRSDHSARMFQVVEHIRSCSLSYQHRWYPRFWLDCMTHLLVVTWAQRKHWIRKTPLVVRASLQLDNSVSRPLQRVAMDILGPLPETARDYATTPVLPINSSACKIPAFINNIRALVLYWILVLLSHATLQANQCIIDTHSGQLQFAAGRNMTLPLSVTLNEAAAHVNTLGTTLHIPPGSVIEVMDQLPVLGLWRVQ
eukprot:Em0113g9a